MSTRRTTLSLRTRVLVAFSVIAAIAVAVAVTVTVLTHAHLMRQLDDRLSTFAGPGIDMKEPPNFPPGGGSTRPETPSDQQGDWVRPSDVLRGFIDTSGSLWIVFAPTVGETDAVPLITVDQLPTDGAVIFSTPSSEGGAGFRVLARAHDDLVDITALPLTDVSSTTRNLILIEAVGIGAMLAVLALVAVWVIRLGINPMRRMVHASTQVAQGDLSVRLVGAGEGSESAELATSLNLMIETLTDSLEEKERSQERLRDFVADASHELRTPLTTVLGYAELAQRGALESAEDNADAWARTEAEASRMKRLVNDLLDLAKYDAEPRLARVPVEFLGLCREVAGDASLSYPSATVSVSGDEVTVLGDPDRLRQAVINVVRNALEHGGTHVTMTVHHEAGAIHLTIADNGPGIPEAVGMRATERFVRGDHARSRTQGGAGLGLSITDAIIDAHGGSLAIHSSPETGTIVVITLPG